MGRRKSKGGFSDWLDPKFGTNPLYTRGKRSSSEIDFSFLTKLGTGKRRSTSGSGSFWKSIEAEQRRNLKLQEKLVKLQTKQDELSQNIILVEEFEEQLRSITSFHREQFDGNNWQAALESAAPFSPDEIGPKETAAQKELLEFRPGFLQRLNKSALEKKTSDLINAVELARAEDQALLHEWMQNQDMARIALSGDVPAICDLLSENTESNEFYFFCTQSKRFQHQSEILNVDFHFNTRIVPAFSLKVNRTGAVTRKELSKTAHNVLIQETVASAAFGLAKQVLAKVPLSIVMVHMVDNVLDPTIGQYQEKIILSGVFERSLMDQINFDQMDPVRGLELFPHHMKFLKTIGLKPVERITY